MSQDQSCSTRLAILDLIDSGVNTSLAIERKVSRPWRATQASLQELRSSGMIKFDHVTGIWSRCESKP